MNTGREAMAGACAVLRKASIRSADLMGLRTGAAGGAKLDAVGYETQRVAEVRPHAAVR